MADRAPSGAVAFIDGRRRPQAVHYFTKVSWLRLDAADDTVITEGGVYLDFLESYLSQHLGHGLLFFYSIPFFSSLVYS